MTPQEYLERLNAESARRREEQSRRMLADQYGSSAGTAPELTSADVRSGTGSTTRTAPGTTTEPRTPASPAVNRQRGDVDPTSPMPDAAGSALRWVGRIVWGAAAGIATALVPGLEQLIGGRLLTPFALFVFYDDIVWFLRTSWELQDAVGQDGATLEQWFGWLVIAHAVWGAASRIGRPKDEPTGAASLKV